MKQRQRKFQYNAQSGLKSCPLMNEKIDQLEGEGAELVCTDLYNF